MVKDILLLTKSKKNKGYCVTGIDVRSGEWIRLIASEDNNYPIELFKYDLGKREPELLDLMRVDVGKSCGTDLHPEDCIANMIYLKRSMIQGSREAFFKRLYQDKKHEHIYYNTDYRLDAKSDAEQVKAGHYSLHLLMAKDLILYKNEWGKWVASFIYGNHKYNCMRVTDDLFIKSIESNSHSGRVEFGDNYYIVVSLGEPFCNPYSGKVENYKLIASIIDKQLINEKLVPLDLEFIGTLEEVCDKYFYNFDYPLTVTKKNWAEDFCFMIESIKANHAIGSMYKGNNLYKANVIRSLYEDGFKIHKSMSY